MRKLFILLTILLPLVVLAGTTNNVGSDIIDSYKATTDGILAFITIESLYIFGVLALVGFVIEMGLKFLQGDFDLGSVMAALVRNILIFGIFKAFIVGGYLDIIFKSFSQLGDSANSAAGVSTKVSVDTIFEVAWELLGKIGEAQSFWPGEISASIIIGLIGLVAAFGIILIGVELLVTYIKVLVMISLSPIFLAFGVLSHTRHWAISAIAATMQASVEYMVLKLIVGLSITNIQNYAKVATTDKGSLFALLIMVLIIFSLSKMAHSIAASFFSGQSAGNNTQAFGRAGAVGAGATGGAIKGAAAGASAGYSAVKEAASKSDSGSSLGTNAKAVGAGAMRSIGGAMGGAIKGAASGVASGNASQAFYDQFAKKSSGGNSNDKKKDTGSSDSSSSSKSSSTSSTSNQSEGEIKPSSSSNNKD